MKTQVFWIISISAMIFATSCDFIASRKSDKQPAEKEPVLFDETADFLSNPDSLDAKLELVHDVNYKAKLIINTLSNADFSDNLSKKIYYLEKLDSLANINDDLFEKADILFKTGTFYNEISCYELAESCYEKALSQLVNLKNDKTDELKAEIYLNQGNNCIYTNDYVKASEVLVLAGDYFESTKNYEYLIKVYTALNAIYLAQRVSSLGENRQKLIEQENLTCEKIIALEPFISDGVAKSSCINAYINHLLNEEDYDRATIYLAKLDSISRACDFVNGQLAFYGNSGFTEEKKGNLNKAIEFYYKCYEMAMKHNLISYAAQSLSNAANTAYADNNMKLCKKYSQMGLDLVDTLHLDDFKWRYMDRLSSIAEEEKDYKTALKYRNEAVDIYIAVHNEKNANQINQYAARFESVQKERKIKQMKYDSEQKNLLILLLTITVFLSIIIFSVIILYRRKLSIKQKQLADRQIKQLEQEKQLIATQAVLDGEVQERSRLARDLHDGLGSMLTGIKINLESLKNGIISGNYDLKYFNNAMKILEDSISEMRRVAHHLMPDTLIRSGLQAALNDFCSSFPLIEYAWFGSSERIGNSQLKVMIYRIIHELVNNALKHSGATKIVVNVMHETTYIAFTVYDNGCGFNQEQQTQGMGLKNIRERVASCNGRMELDTAEGKGTEINIELRI